MISCAKCGNQFIRRELNSVESGFAPQWIDNCEIVPEGMFWATKLSFFQLADDKSDTKVIVVNGGDVIGLLEDSSKCHGCCGNCEHVPNRLCYQCEAAVGTRIDDCWTSFYLYFFADNVNLRGIDRNAQ